MKMVINRLKVPAVIFIAFVGFMWVACSRFFNTSDSDIYYSEKKYNEGLSRIYYDLGILRQQRGDLKNACRAFKSSIQADSSLLAAYDALSLAYSLRNKPDKALAIQHKAALATQKKHPH